LYTRAEVKSALLAYVAKHELVNRVEQQYLNVSADAVFSAALYGSPNAKSAVPVPEFAKREDALSALCGRMQPWYRIAIGGDEPFTKKGVLRPITVATKTRQGRKACTFITGFEQYHLSGDALAEALRVRCASSTSGTYCLISYKQVLFPDMMCTVSPVAGGVHEVMVQGKQTPAVLELLGSLGVPEKWIEVTNTVGKKK
jgi:translation initiation factor 2D